MANIPQYPRADGDILWLDSTPATPGTPDDQGVHQAAGLPGERSLGPEDGDILYAPRPDQVDAAERAALSDRKYLNLGPTSWGIRRAARLIASASSPSGESLPGSAPETETGDPRIKSGSQLKGSSGGLSGGTGRESETVPQQDRTGKSGKGVGSAHYLDSEVKITGDSILLGGVRIPIKELRDVTRVLSYGYPLRKLSLIMAALELAISIPIAVVYGSTILVLAGFVVAIGLAAAIYLDSRRNPQHMRIEATWRERRVLLFETRDSREFGVVWRALIRALEDRRMPSRTEGGHRHTGGGNST